jgi:hypothetical protein
MPEEKDLLPPPPLSEFTLPGSNEGLRLLALRAPVIPLSLVELL